VTSLLLPSLFCPAAAIASQPVQVASALTPQVRVSSGVIAPKLLDSANVTIPQSYLEGLIPGGAQVVVALVVNQNGRAQDVRVVKSFNQLWDASVTEAVRQFHFSPGTVSGSPVAVPMNLTVNITQ
jgi:TonB family protein